jgi:hypothetical protein
VIDIHKKFLKLVQEAFSGEQGFTAALDKVNHFISILIYYPGSCRLAENL